MPITSFLRQPMRFPERYGGAEISRAGFVCVCRRLGDDNRLPFVRVSVWMSQLILCAVASSLWCLWPLHFYTMNFRSVATRDLA